MAHKFSRYIDTAVDRYTFSLKYDYVLPCVLFIFSILISSAEKKENLNIAFSSAALTFSAFVLTAAVFACSMTYQSSNIVISSIRKTYSTELRKNWSSIIFWSLFCAFFSAISIPLIPLSSSLSYIIAFVSIGMSLMKGIRSVIWLKTVFLSEEYDDKFSHEEFDLVDAISYQNND
ncbi:Uncharacterised protein [Rothia aeria]|uniref:Uncharacterized protein n=1 Tax=Rothia aeria TaxID=172042 RepID=A0A7Z9A6M5_9MICC|nr:hypothetical protein [Rothia aeria]VEI24480.1 Uncharacterised protein [Rothia aeria]